MKLKDDALVSGFRPSVSPALPPPVASPEQQIAVALLGEGSIEDCAVLSRTTAAGRRVQVAYVVCATAFSAERIQAYLELVLPAVALPDAYVPLSSLPLTPEGQVDEQALSSLAVLDDETIRQWETSLKAQTALEQVAVVLQAASGAESPASLHLSDLLPHWQRAIAAHDSTPPTTGSDATTVEPDPSSPVLFPSPVPSPVPAIAAGGALPQNLEAPATLPGILVQASQIVGDRIVYLQPDGSVQAQSYADLLSEAERILSGLRQCGLNPQDKVIFQLERSQDILPAFWGCILGGFIPVIMATAPTYRDVNSAVEKLFKVWTLLDRPLILSTAALQDPLRQLSATLSLPELATCAIKTLRHSPPDANHHPSQPQDPAFFNLTSGSTGTPKCISLTHWNLIARSRGTNLLNRHAPEDIILNWLPFDHIGSISDWHIRCVDLGCHMVYAAKDYVLGRPLNWLDLIHRYRISHSWAPNFAYALVNDALKQESAAQSWDLSCVQSLLTAGEAVSSNAVTDFIDNLAAYGFKQTAIRPAFGMAEMGSGITYFQPTAAEPVRSHRIASATFGRPIRRVGPDYPNCNTFADLGPPIPGITIRIVDGSTVLPEETIGSLQVKGDAVSLGYYDNPTVNAEVFLADGWFDTGDLGFIAQGQLVVTGRAKETIIINGANYYNHEIEAAVEELAGVEVSYTAACAIRDGNSATEKLAIFFHTPLTAPADRIALLKTIRQTVVSKIGLNPTFLLPVPQAAIPKTGIGKIQRSQLSQQFSAGAFDAVLKEVDLLLGNANTLPDWFYRKIWQPKQLSPLSVSEAIGTVVVLMDAAGLGAALSAEMERSNQPCIQVEAGQSFRKIASDRYEIDGQAPEHYVRLLTAIAADHPPIAQILHLWTYGESCGEAASAPEIEAALNLGTYSTLFLIQALSPLEPPAPIRLRVVSNAVQPTAATDVVVAEKSPVLGLLKAAPQEIPWLRCYHLDLEFEDAIANGSRLRQELTHLHSDSEVAYRGGQRLVPRLEKVDWTQADRQPIPFKQGGMYLLSGGLGGIGVELSKYLLETYGARLLLLGRTPLPAAAEGDQDPRRAAYDTLARQKGTLRYAAVDICDLEALRQTVAQATSDWQCELDGIIHLAGTVSERSLSAETRDSLAAALRPKVLGTWTLNRLVEHNPDCFFIHFSSVVSHFGGAMVGAYGAANTFLNHYSHRQRYHDARPSYCFAWGMWDGIGMSRDALGKELWRLKGYLPATFDQGLSALLAGLHCNQDALWVGLDGQNRNIRRYTTDAIPTQALAAYYVPPDLPDLPDLPDPSQSARFAAVLSETTVCDRFGTPTRCRFHALAALPLTDTQEIDRAQLAAWSGNPAAEQVKPSTEIDAQLVEIWQTILGVARVGVRDNFFELGGTSLQAARVFAEIDRAFGKNLPLATLFEAQTIAQIAEYLTQDLTPEQTSSLWSSLVPIQPQGSKPPLFCIHGAGGNILMYRGLSQYLGADQPLYGLQPQGLDAETTPIDRLQEMAELYVAQMRKLQPEGPYYLTGLSVGGLIAYEMARILEAQGQKIALLAIIDALGPGYPKLLPLFPRCLSLLPFVLATFPGKIVARLKQRFASSPPANPPAANLDHDPDGDREQDRSWLPALGSLQDKEQLEQQFQNADSATDSDSMLGDRAPRKLSWVEQLEALSLWVYKFTPWAFIVPNLYLESGREFPTNSLQKVQEANVRAMLAYLPQPYAGGLVLFRASSQPPGCYPDLSMGWDKVVQGTLEIHDIPGHHGEGLLYDAPSLEVLGRQLKTDLDAAQAGAS
jgi:acyl-CoA synthetase (AMP-forming)/AMP-acid ligase II/thioesterase domain-containing protein/acyl carrier protein/NADP-dependent 3-hydroxy acid dehydrogenase YdfG